MISPHPRIVCFGEILWDFLPGGLFPGGAPFNVAYHLHRLGARVLPVSAVGQDVIGDELMRRLARWDIRTDGIARLARFPTGFVRAEISPAGNAHYDITTRVAWDHIAANAATRREVPRAHAFIFGSLAQRAQGNRHLLQSLLSALPLRALKVFDVNLRPPYDDLPLVRRLSRGVHVLKLNDLEAARLVGKKFKAGNDEGYARQLAAEFGCARVVITAAERGAGLLHEGDWHWEKGRRVRVVDTVGAGDSFLAALVTHLLAGESDSVMLARACRLGEWVATQPGATPPYNASTPR